jgi:hypothetical protein
MNAPPQRSTKVSRGYLSKLVCSLVAVASRLFHADFVLTTLKVGRRNHSDKNKFSAMASNSPPEETLWEQLKAVMCEFQSLLKTFTACGLEGELKQFSDGHIKISLCLLGKSETNDMKCLDIKHEWPINNVQQLPIIRGYLQDMLCLLVDLHPRLVSGLLPNCES